MKAVNPYALQPTVSLSRSSFNRSHGNRLTMDSGYLIPVFVDEALPGDTFNLNMSGFGRMATPLHPIMDNLHFDTFFFAVPNRLLWEHWQEFNGEQANPGDATDYLVPTLDAPPAGFGFNSLADYFGLPPDVPLTKINSLHFRAYNLIYNEWFRDENLIDSLPMPIDDGPDSISDFVLKRRGKRHDYFTSCLPWPQKGEEVTLPLGTTAPVKNTFWAGHGQNFYDPYMTVDGLYQLPKGQSYSGISVINPGANEPNPFLIHFPNTEQNEPTATTDKVIKFATPPEGLMYTDLSEATAATIRDLRRAAQIQVLYEKDAISGTRYTEILRRHFGVVSPDQRLQRPEFLGGGSSMIYVNAVTQTSETTVDSPQGNLAAVGTVQFNGHGFVKSFTEHCVLIGLASIRADLSYQQGVNRMWSRQTRWDYFWPDLASIGEQAVLSKEIYADGTTADDDVFGYQERYAEYRYKPGQVSGEFRSNHPQSLDTWHLSQDFATRPLLNELFIEDNPPVSRVIAVPSEPEFILDSYFKYICARPMPVRAIPGMGGRL